MGFPRPNNINEGQSEQVRGTKFGKRPSPVEADTVYSVSGALMNRRGGAYSEGWWNKQDGYCVLGEGLI